MLARENGLLNLIQDFNRKLFFKFDKTKLTPEYRIANVRILIKIAYLIHKFYFFQINSKATAKRNVEFDFNLFEGAESSADDSTDGGKEYDDDDEEPEEASAYEEEESFNTSEPESSSSRVTSLLYDDEEFESQPAVAHRRDSHVIYRNFVL